MARRETAGMDARHATVMARRKGILARIASMEEAALDGMVRARRADRHEVNDVDVAELRWRGR